MIRPLTVILLVGSLSVLTGCGLFSTTRRPVVEGPPPYLSSQNDEMSNDLKYFRRSEMTQLEKEADAFDAERKREKERAEKKNMFSWFGKSNSPETTAAPSEKTSGKTSPNSFMMSKEANRISHNLDR